MSLKTMWQQYFPAEAPSFTEANLAPGSQEGKVFIITGGNSGIGKELARFLYPTGARIYLAGRSEERIARAIEDIEASSASTGVAKKGCLRSLHGLDLSDLCTVKPVFERFAAQEKELHVLWNNAAMPSRPGRSSPQGIELSMAANALGPFLLTSLLVRHLGAGAKNAGRPSRVVWTGSVQIEMNAPLGGVDFERLNQGKTISQHPDYAQSKAANLLLAHESAIRWGDQDIISVCQNPGNLYTNIYARENWLLVLFLRYTVLYEAKYGAYTMMFAGFSDKISMAQNGCYIWPWGVIKPNSREDVYKAIDQGKARDFWEWCEDKIGAFM
ncbi:NAD(P)-binding protein [Aaosphaeria arxii CBS 175.79]|uniref:NAD(P)-binding protein n=1 Tax=Aaosphaeria arxii CBS 175.79 TaxID=1450172 RepID=A0A6A5XGQ8_9PLEO|nr:NAD(P)-binding protein [Aaosphaeria arxii CBS 175.79]KAF2012046.1 NAD(P)-binding protein [Aaosphaeria arxii CBS 175.79]